MRLSLWIAAGLGLGLTCGPPGALWSALTAAGAHAAHRSRALDYLVRATLAVGLAALIWAAPLPLGAVLGALAALYLCARDRGRAWQAAIGVGVVLLVTALAAGGGRGAPPSWLGSARVVSGLLLAAAALSMPAPSRRPWLGPLVAALIVVAALVVRAGLFAAGAVPLVSLDVEPAPRTVEAARLGARALAARAQRDRTCALLVEGQRKGAVRALSWGGLLAPQLLLDAEAQLWRASLIEPGDPKQARAVAGRVFRRFDAEQVRRGVAPRGRDFVLQLAAWAEEDGHTALVDALVAEAAVGQVATGFTTCQPRPPPP